jgi:hypothetical protein
MFINGCSHTAGCEIDGTYESVYNRENAFGAQIAKRLNITFTNNAMNGASNDYIMRTTVHWILDNPDLAKETLFFINWTSAERAEYFHDDKKFSQSLWWNVPYVPDTEVGHMSHAYFSGVPKEYGKNAKIISSNTFLNPAHWEINRYNNIIYLQTILKAMGLKYVFRNGFTCSVDSKRYKNYIKHVDLENFVGLTDLTKTYFEHCESVGFKKSSNEFWHLPLEAHTYWANSVYDDIFKFVNNDTIENSNESNKSILSKVFKF